jgi:hypothetical protein
MRERLNANTNWKEIMDVKISDVRTIVNGTLSTEPSVVIGTRGSAYAYGDFTITADTCTISTYYNIPMFIDEADRTQQAYFGSPEIADFQGKKINEYLETATLATHASWTNFGAGDLANTSANDTTQITVSATNIDDIIRAIKRYINSKNGADLAAEKGYFIVWRPEDMEMLEAFVQANGFTEADYALKNGIVAGLRYMNVDHYMSTKHATGHLMAGVKKVGKTMGILRGTYGKVKFIEDPGNVSGLGIVSRIDYGFAFPASGTLELTLDVNVS